MRRFNLLTNDFSKKVKNHERSLTVYGMYYNFICIHQSIRFIPGMEAGISNHV